MRLIWSPIAIDRVTEIADYIAQDNINASVQWIDALFKEVDMLREFPDSGRTIPELNKTSIRELIFGNYRIIYRRGKQEISILTVRHIKQILPLDQSEFH